MPSPLMIFAFFRADAACPEPVDIARLSAQLTLAEERFAALEGATFSVAMDEASFLVPCLAELVPPDLVARYHRLQGLNLFMSRNEERARAAFAAARASDAEAGLPVELVPEGHVIRELWAVADPSGPSARVPPPIHGSLMFDGEPSSRRPVDRPTLVQVLSEEGRPLASAWIEPGDPLPPYEARRAPKDPEDRLSLPRVPLLAGGGAAALLGGVLYGVAATRAAQFEGPKPPEMDLEDLRASQRTTNTLVVGSAVAGGLSVLTVGAAVVVGRW